MPTFISDPLVTHLRVIRLPCYLFTLFHFASSARTKNLIVTPNRSLAMGHSFTVGACGILFHIGLRLSTLLGALWDW
jgi:hypothetical protein